MEKGSDQISQPTLIAISVKCTYDYMRHHMYDFEIMVTALQRLGVSLHWWLIFVPPFITVNICIHS